MKLKKQKQIPFQGISALLMLAFIWACRPEGQLAQWDLEGLSPIAKTRVDYQDIVNDSNIVYDPDGLVRLVYRDRIAELKPGEIAPPFNETFENTANIRQLALNNRKLRNRISLGRLASELGVQGALLIAANGTNQVIPPLNNIGPTSFPVDATDFFQSITLRDGWLVLRIENQFPIELTNLIYEIKNTQSNTIIVQNNLPSLMPNAVHYDSVHLVNNFVIEGELTAMLVNMDSPGSNGQSVAIDTSDAILLEVSLDKLDPVEATAIWPSQNLFDETATAEIKPESGLLTKVFIKQGSVFIDAVSSISDELRLGYDLPGAIRDGQPLELRETIPAAPPGGSIQVRRNLPVEAYELDMTGLPGSTGVFNTFYTTFTGGIDSTGKLVNLSLSDSVFIRTGIDSLVANRGYGYLGTDTIEAIESFELDAFRNVLSGSVSLQELAVNLEIDNFVGAPFEFQIANLSALSTNGTSALQWSELGRKLNVPPALELSPGQKPRPGRLNLLLDHTNSNILDLLEESPDSFQTEIKAFLNAGIPSTELNQFIYTDYGIEAFFKVEVPLKLVFNDLELGDRVDFDYRSIDPDRLLIGGSFLLKANNFYPFRAEVEIELYDRAGQLLSVLSSAESVEPSERDSDQRSIRAVESMLEYALDAEALTDLKDCDYLFFKLRFNSPQPNEVVHFYSDNYIDLQLIGDFQFKRP